MYGYPPEGGFCSLDKCAEVRAMSGSKFIEHMWAYVRITFDEYIMWVLPAGIWICFLLFSIEINGALRSLVLASLRLCLFYHVLCYVFVVV